MEYGTFLGVLGGIASFIGPSHSGLIKAGIGVVIGCMILGKRLTKAIKEAIDASDEVFDEIKDFFGLLNGTVMSVKFIAGKDHYDKVVSKVSSVKRSLWIGTADIKDLYVKCGNTTKPFLAVLADLLRRGVEIRLIHAKEPGPEFREDFDKYPTLKSGLERMLCPRVHFKMLIFDLMKHI